MAIQIIKCKDQLIKEICNGGIREQSVITLPQQGGPLQQYSNLFYWANHVSDYGCTIPDLTNIGFEIVSFVTKGSYDVLHKEKDSWTQLNEGDVALIKSGKGIRYAEKLHPRSEILQIWLKPNFNQYRKREPELLHCNAASFQMEELDGKKTCFLGGEGTCLSLESKDVSIELNQYSAGFHTLTCPQDAVLSCHILQGFLEISDVTLGKDDFFKIEGVSKVKIASLVNTQVFMTVTPFTPEYRSNPSLQI